MLLSPRRFVFCWINPQPMKWMGHADAVHNGLMPGMATDAQMKRLQSLHGNALDVFFLQLMIHHHQGGIPMARYAAAHASRALRPRPRDGDGHRAVERAHPDGAVAAHRTAESRSPRRCTDRRGTVPCPASCPSPRSVDPVSGRRGARSSIVTRRSEARGARRCPCSTCWTPPASAHPERWPTRPRGRSRVPTFERVPAAEPSGCFSWSSLVRNPRAILVTGLVGGAAVADAAVRIFAGGCLGLKRLLTPCGYV